MKSVRVALAAVALCTLFAASAAAQANFALRGIGLKAGVVDPEDVDATLGLGLVFDLGTLAPQVAVESYAGFWSQTEEAYGTEVGVRDFSFGGKVKYVFQTANPTVQPYAGAGLGLHVFDSHADIAPVYFGGTLMFPGSSVSDTAVKVGLDLGGGLRVDRGRQFAFTGDLWYTVCDVNHLSFMIGAEYMFGR